jgi:phosphoribosylanthranilate isomerase
MMPRIKICCIGSVAEAQLAVAHGASALGLVSEMPSGPGVIPDDQISAIAATVPKFIGTFLLTSRTESAPIIEHIRRCGTNTVQLVDAVGENVYQELRRELPDIRIVQVVHVTGDAAIDEARRIAGRVDALLLDSGNPALEIKELGGTGRTHDWNRSRQIVESVKCPVFLAGGLNHLNILEAVRQVQPYGVDICTGVRTEGRLDPLKLTDFFAAIRRLAS